MIKFPKGLDLTEVQKWAEQQGFYIRHGLKTTPVLLVASPQSQLDTAESIIKAFRRDFPLSSIPKLAVAEKDYLVFPTLLPDDTSFGSLWGLNNTGQAGGVADADIDAPEAWNIATGSRDVLVGILDTGIDRTHPDLAVNMWANPAEIAGNGVDDDGNGFVDDVYGWDFFANDANPHDEGSHGTHCAGTIGAVGNNRAGVAGVCWQVSLVGIRFLGPSGGSTSDAIESVHYATSLGVDLTSNSWGGGGESQLLLEAIDAAGAENILFVAAAGNDGTDNDLMPHYPSNYETDHVLSVASSTPVDDRSPFSNYGRTTVDLAAPGSGILSTVPGPSYATMSGTSMATPHVTGALALAKSIAPLLLGTDLKRKVMETSDKVPELASTTVSGGRLNVHRLLENVAGAYPLVTVTSVTEMPGGNGDGIANPGEALALNVKVTNRGTQSASNVTARIVSTAGSGSRFIVEDGLVNAGNLGPGQMAAEGLRFVVRSHVEGATPYTEPMMITLTYGMPEQLLVQHVDLRLYTSSVVTGTVRDLQNGTGLAGATVVLDGPSVVTLSTAADGSYEATLTDGSYRVHARATGYVPSGEAHVSVPPGSVGTDFLLGRPQLTLTPDSVTAEVLRGDMEHREVKMTNEGSVPLVWRARLRSLAAPTTFFHLPAAKVPESSPDAVGETVKINRVVPVATLPMSTLSGVKIGAVHTPLSRSVLTDDLQQRGAVIVDLLPPLTSASLDGLDAVILDDMVSVLTQVDLQNLRAAVEGGTGLLCEADNSESIANTLVLLNGTGVMPVYANFRDLTLTDMAAHPITAGVALLRELAAGWTLTLSGPAQPLVREAGGKVHAAVSTLGRGIVVVVGNEITNAENFETGDGRRFANQIVDGLMAGPEWLEISPLSGEIEPGEEAVLSLVMDARTAVKGRHVAELTVLSNIPDEPPAVVPVTLDVREVPVINMPVRLLDFGDVIERTPVTREIPILNSGAEDLTIESAFVGTTAFALPAPAMQTLAPGASGAVRISFSPAAPLGRHEAVLQVATNDPRLPMMTVQVKGNHVPAPNVTLTPARTDVRLAQGQEALRDFTVKNTGVGLLRARAEILHGSGTPMDSIQVVGVTNLVLTKGKTAKVTVRFAAGKHPPAIYGALLRLVSDDPDTPTLDRPLLLTTTSAPVVVAEAVVFDKTLVGQPQTRVLRLGNEGATPLTIKSARGLNAAFRVTTKPPLVVAPGEAKDIAITFAPAKEGALASSLAFSANVPGGSFKIPVSGLGARLPVVKVTPASFSITTAPGMPMTRTVQIANGGSEPLRWSANVPSADVGWLLPVMAGAELAGKARGTLQLNFNTEQMQAGTYRTDVSLWTNDPARPLVLIPITLKVTSQSVVRATPVLADLGKVWTQQTLPVRFDLENVGNLPVDIKSVVSNKAELVPSWNGNVTLAPGGSVAVLSSLLSPKKQIFSGALTVRTNSRTTAAVKLSVKAEVIKPPELLLNPGEITQTVNPTRSVESVVKIANAGEGRLDWTVDLVEDFPAARDAASLQQILQRLNTRHAELTALVPHLQTFTDGVTGYSIEDGGNNMYDIGNLISTNLNGGQAVGYADNAVVSSASLGSSSRYFTRKVPGLFVLGAQLADVSTFRIRGGLGANGAGRATGLVLHRHGYVGFLKQVSGAAGVPSVNHLILLPEDAALAHSFPENTDLDHHDVTGLPASTRLYLLVFGSAAGTSVSETEASQLMDHFLSRVVHDVGTPWLQVLDPNGQTEGGGTSALRLNLHAGTLAAGSYIGKIRVRSNAPQSLETLVPVTMMVPSTGVLAVEPMSLTFPNVPVNGSSDGTLTLKNLGNDLLEVTAVDCNEAAFKIQGLSLPFTIAAGQTRAIPVKFSPLEPRDYTGKITVLSSAEGGSSVNVSVSGKGIAAPLLRVSPETLTLTTRPGVPVSQDIILENLGTAPLNWTMENSFTTMVLSAFSGTLVPGGTKVVTVTTVSSATSTPGMLTQGISLTSNDPLRPMRSVIVVRTILAEPVLQVQPTALNFGSVLLPGSVTVPVTLRNTGNANLYIRGIRSPSAFLQSSAEAELPLTLAPGGTRTVQFRYAPGGQDVLAGAVEFSTNNPENPSTFVPVAGQAVIPPQLSVTPASLSIAVEEGQQFSTGLNIRNDGGSALSWNVTVESAGAGQWLQPSLAGGSVAPGNTAFLGINVNARSLLPSIKNAILKITSNAVENGSVEVPVTVQVTPSELGLSTRMIESATLEGRAGPPSVLGLQTRPGENPAWTLSTNVPWLQPSVTAGNGSAEVSLTYSAALPAGEHVAQVRVATANVVRLVDVRRVVAKAEYELLQSDRTHNRLLGLVRGGGGAPSFLVAIHPDLLMATEVLPLPTDITSMDASTNGRILYAISFAGKTVSEVNLDSFEMTATKPLGLMRPAAGNFFQVQAGREGRLYYTDAAVNPTLHVYDFASGSDVATFNLPGAQGIGAFVVTPDARMLYARSKSSWTGTGTAYVAAVDCATDVLTQTAASSFMLAHEPGALPLLLDANMESIITLGHFLTLQDLASGAQGKLTEGRILNASPYLDLWVENGKVVRADDGQVLHTLPAGVNATAFIPDGTGLVYYDPAAARLSRVALSGLPPVGIVPGLENTSVQNVTLKRLTWSGDPGLARYDVYVGTDAMAVSNAVFGTPQIFQYSTPATLFDFSPGYLVPGRTYYWRIDGREDNGSLRRGPVWSFKIADACMEPGSLSFFFKGSGEPLQQVTMTIATARADTAWRLACESPWVVLDKMSGIGPATVTVSVDPAGLASGRSKAEMMLAADSDVVRIPLDVDVLGHYQVVKMVADPALNVVYALHREPLPPFSSWMLWVDGSTGTVQDAVKVGSSATDLACHRSDDQLFVLVENGRFVQAVERSGGHALKARFAMPSPQAAIHPGPAGRIVTLSTANSLQLRLSGTGAAVGTARQLAGLGSTTVATATGTDLYAAVKLHSGQVGLSHCIVTPTAMSDPTLNLVGGNLEGPLLLSANHERLVYDGKMYSSRDLSLYSTLGLAAVAVTGDAAQVMTSSAIYEVAAPSVPLAQLPEPTAQMAVPSVGGRVLLFSPVSRTFVPVMLP